MDGNLYGLLHARFEAAGLLRRDFDPATDRPALVTPEGYFVTYRRLDESAARVAGALAALDVAPGDRVVAQVGKSVMAVALYLGCLRRGAVFVPLNTAYTDAEVDYFVGDCEPRLFVGPEGRERPARVPTAITDAELWPQVDATEPQPGIASRHGDDLASIVYTSGTTGRSKGAMLSHRNLASNAQTLVRIWGMSSNDVLLHALPIYHVHGLFVALHCALLSTCTVHFLPKFDAVQVRDLLPFATVMMGVPTFYTRLLALRDFGREHSAKMRLFISGSAPLLAETHREFEARSGHRILERYGMTETGMITSNPLDGERVAGTVGFPLPDVEVRVRQDDGALAETGEPGVLELRGPNVFSGYWRQPEKTAQDFRDGWFVTGDIATRAADGRITLVGRAKDLIITGGLNVYPKEVEELIDAIDGVEESAVVGVPDADFGEAVVAVVVRSSGSEVTEASLDIALRQNLASFKRPKRFLFVDELPRNAMGKVQKNLLRQRLQPDQ